MEIMRPVASVVHNRLPYGETDYDHGFCNLDRGDC
jgi:hypothetical protein